MRLSATKIDEHNWFYDDHDGIGLIHEAFLDGKIKTDSITIPWSVVRAALARHDRKKQPEQKASH